MATVTYVRTIKYVAEILGEDPELLQAIVSNDDNLTYGSIIVSAHFHTPFLVDASAA